MTPVLMALLIVLISALPSELTGRDTKDSHDVDIIYVVSENEDMTYDFTVDGEEVFYADFSKQQLISALPPFANPMTCPSCFGTAYGDRKIMKHNLEVTKKAEKYPPEVKVAPDVRVYPSEHVELGKENFLICFISHFYPPSVNVKWTRNNQQVSLGVSMGRYQINSESMSYVFSHLAFTPQEGDIYSCTVEHTALDSPVTKIWECDVRRPSVAPDVICGLGLTTALFGVAIGTFFLMKGYQQRRVSTI